MLYLTAEAAECLSLRIADIIEYSPTKEAFIGALGQFSVGSLEEMKNLHLHDFGIFLELEPDEEEKALLEANIQMALSKDSIYLEDAIDIREIRNLKLANQMLKLRQKEKQERDRAQQLENIQAQAQANAESAEKAAMAELQKNQAMADTEVQIEQAKSQFEIQRMEQEALIKKQLMAEEFRYDMQLAQIQGQAQQQKEAEIEDRKDKRIRMQGTQESELISQRQNDTLPKDFESAGNDTLGGFGLEQFNPR